MLITPKPKVTGYFCLNGHYHIGYLEDYHTKNCPKRGKEVLYLNKSFEKKDKAADKKAGIKENSKKDKYLDKKKK